MTGATHERRRIRGTPPVDYHGLCGLCGLRHRFRNDVPLALSAIEELFDQLDSDAVFAEEQRALAASKGKMLGVLVARSSDGARQVLRSYSGELANRRDWPAWVRPVLRREDTAALEAETLARIGDLNDQIATCDIEKAQQELVDAKRARAVVRSSDEGRVKAARQALLSERARLRDLTEQRRSASMLLSTAMFDAATVTNARGEERRLRAVFAGDGIAGGTTDCAVPKLLEAANVKRLTPIALAEAWWGPTINGRVHGDIQLPCERKCLPVLGYLLCGLEESGLEERSGR